MTNSRERLRQEHNAAVANGLITKARHIARKLDSGDQALLANGVGFVETLDVERLREALISEDEIAHGEAWTQERGGLGRCAYCDDDWPCRTQRGIDRLLAALATPKPGELL